MKLASALTFIGLGIGVASFAAIGCGETTEEDGTSSATTGKQPPAKPTSGTTPAGTEERTFALNALFLGEADRAGTPNKDAWKDYGFNIDRKATTRNSTDVCKAVRPANQEDGNQGIDNAFGKTIIPFLQPFAAAPSKQLNDEVNNKGTFTILMSITGLTDDAAQTSTDLSGKLLVGGPLGEKPVFSPTLDWPYRPEPQISLAGSYINAGTFVYGGGGASVKLSILLSGVSLDITINNAVVSFKHQPPNDLVDGTIAGVIPTETLISGIEKVASKISSQFCGGSALESVKNSIREASDIMQDGSNNPGANCDAISVGLGFTAKRVANPTKTAAADPPGEDKCNPTGDGG